MKTRWLVISLWGLFFLVQPKFVLAQSVSSTDSYKVIQQCIVDVQVWYNDLVSKCLTEKSLPLKKFQDPTNYQEGDAEKVQALLPQIQVAQQICYQGANLDEYKKKIGVCYKDNPVGGVWDLPAVKKALIAGQDDWRNLTSAEGQIVYNCLNNLIADNDLTKLTAKSDEDIAQCFSLVGIKSLTKTYQTAAIVLDCVQVRFPFQTRADAVRVFSNQTAEDKEYIEQCILKKVVPAVTVTAVANVPLVAGWKSIFLFGQLLVTQPIVLWRRKKYKTWGTVFDASTLTPVDLSSVRLVDVANNKIISTAVTNLTGAYLFLAKPGKYRVEVDKTGYNFPSALLTAGVFEHDHYFGEPIVIKTGTDVIDRHVPIDPDTKPISVFKFRLHQWRYKLAMVLGFVSPIISLTGFILIPKWWIGLLSLGHLVIFGIFLRLSIRAKHKKFGVVIDENKTTLSGVQVSLFRKQDNKLLGFYVTDLFGRYFFPRLVGDYFLVFKKVGFAEEKIPFTLTKQANGKTTISHDIKLTKIK